MLAVESDCKQGYTNVDQKSQGIRGSALRRSATATIHRVLVTEWFFYYIMFKE
jgi:hypothetical protein